MGTDLFMPSGDEKHKNAFIIIYIPANLPGRQLNIQPQRPQNEKFIVQAVWGAKMEQIRAKTLQN